MELTTRTFGRLTVLGRDGIKINPSGKRDPLWQVRCTCGRTKTVQQGNLTTGRTTSCGHCVHREKAEDITGQVYGRLTVIRRVQDATPPKWVCRCTCGNVHLAQANNLKSGKVRSCGCLNTEVISGPQTERWLETTGYHNAHRRLRVLKGRAADHTCADCDQPGKEWSYIGGDPNELTEQTHEGGAEVAYSLDPDFYTSRCKRCHAAHDASLRPARTHCRRGHQYTYTPSGKKVCNPCVRIATRRLKAERAGTTTTRLEVVA